MRLVGLALALIFSGSLTAWAPEGAEIAVHRVESVCELGRRIAEAGPCLGPDDCPGFEVWREWLGPPGPRLLEPRGPRHLGSARSGRAPRPALPLTAICLAEE